MSYAAFHGWDRHKFGPLGPTKTIFGQLIWECVPALVAFTHLPEERCGHGIEHSSSAIARMGQDVLHHDARKNVTIDPERFSRSNVERRQNAFAFHNTNFGRASRSPGQLPVILRGRPRDVGLNDIYEREKRWFVVRCCCSDGPIRLCHGPEFQSRGCVCQDT